MTAARTSAAPLAMAGALTGGILAALLVDLATGTTIVVTAVAVVVGAAIAVLLVDTRSPEPVAAPQRRPNDWWAETPAPPPVAKPQAPQPQRMVLGTGRGGQWWEKTGTPGAGPAAPAAAPTPAAAPELTSYVESARVVQCPRCGAFRIDVSRDRAGFAFHCTVDGHRWTWRPDTAWPATVVVSRRRTRI